MSSNIWNATEQKLEQVAGNVNINDSVISEDSTYSSQKIHDSLVDKVPFKFGVTEDGQYGYYKVGADTVTPFKSGADVKLFKFVATTVGQKTFVTEKLGFKPSCAMAICKSVGGVSYAGCAYVITSQEGIADDSFNYNSRGDYPFMTVTLNEDTVTLYENLLATDGTINFYLIVW